MKIEGISTEWVFLVYAIRRLKIEIFVNKKKIVMTSIQGCNSKKFFLFFHFFLLIQIQLILIYLFPISLIYFFFKKKYFVGSHHSSLRGRRNYVNIYRILY